MVHNIQGKIYFYPVDYEPALKVLNKNTLASCIFMHQNFGQLQKVYSPEK